MIQLYDFALSGSCHKVRMLLAQLGLDYKLIDVDLLRGGQRTDHYQTINPLGKVPVLDDNGLHLRDSIAIMVYLAKKYGEPDWWPTSPEDLGDIQQWLSFSVNEIFHGVATARAILLFKRDIDPKPAQELGRKSLAMMEQQLADNAWLACGRLTIADLACYPYIGLAHQGGLTLAEYPSVSDWIRRVEDLPNYVGMPGLPADSA